VLIVASEITVRWSLVVCSPGASSPQASKTHTLPLKQRGLASLAASRSAACAASSSHLLRSSELFTMADLTLLPRFFTDPYIPPRASLALSTPTTPPLFWSSSAPNISRRQVLNCLTERHTAIDRARIGALQQLCHARRYIYRCACPNGGTWLTNRLQPPPRLLLLLSRCKVLLLAALLVLRALLLQSRPIPRRCS
jgi:hypothetical protein